MKRFPKDFMCIGDRSFDWVYENRKEFVDFTLTEMKNAKGFFKDFQQFCKAKLKKESLEK